MSKIYVEAESFVELGGWVIETQSMPWMKSAYVMAHGYGVPVADAKTKIEVKDAGAYHVWVRTRDWTAQWGRGTSAGRFELQVNGTALPTVLGTNAPDWFWQDAGEVTLREGWNELALHDLTGFNSRCDAIYFTTEGDTPENDWEKIVDWRRAITGLYPVDYEEEFDLIVAGGGMAGICTAISAIRNGVKTLLIQDRGVLGGCNSSEIRVSTGGAYHADPYPNLGNVVQEITPIMGSGDTYEAEYYEDARKRMVFDLCKPNMYKLELNTAVVEVEREGNTIKSVLCRSTITGAETRYRAPLFADCTGDGVLALAMGAETMYGTESRAEYGEQLAPLQGSGEVMGQTTTWLSEDIGVPSDFPEVDFGLEITEDNCLYVTGGDWEWECGQYLNQYKDAEYIRDYAVMAIFANWSYLKHHSARKDEWANRRIKWISPIGGKRECYRVKGDLILRQQDIEDQVEYPDATAAITWSIDLHYPDPYHTDKFKEPFRSCAYHREIGKPYAVPYRCLYSKDVPNLFLGGRIISTTHVAFSAVRVMRTLGQLGEVIGMAASICKKHGVQPRAIYTDHLEELKEMMRAGVPVPWYHGSVPHNRHQSYHFKELGFIVIPRDYDKICDDPALRKRIERLDVTHWDGLKMKDVKKTTE